MAPILSPRALVALTVVSIALVSGAALAKPPRPDFRGNFPREQQRRVLDRVNAAPSPYRALAKAAYPRMKVKASSEYVNGSYVVNRGQAPNQRFVVFLDLMTRRAGEYGDHLTVHELGHVVANLNFDEADYARFFELFRRSPEWRECFETGVEGIPCVPREEVLADQLAFYATGVLSFRSSYNVPPLATADEMGRAITAAAG